VTSTLAPPQCKKESVQEKNSHGKDRVEVARAILRETDWRQSDLVLDL